MNQKLDDVRFILDTTVEKGDVPWAVLVLVDKSGIIFEHGANGDLDRADWIASATKVPSILAFMTLAGEGKVQLDDPISAYLPGFDGDKSTMTIRHTMALISGFQFNHPTLDPGPDMEMNWRPSPITLEKCVDEIAKLPLEAPPGKRFIYGSVSHSVYGRVAEVVSGKPWADFFNERLAKPLGMRRATYGPTRNPRLSGGLVCSARDYSQILRLILRNGEMDGHQMIPSHLIREMYQDNGAEFRGPSRDHGPIAYGIGWWINRMENGQATLITDPGGQGAYPWIDLKRGYGGFLFVRKTLQDGTRLFGEVFPIIEAAIDSK